MTSKLIVNNIEADAGVSTITFGSEISASKITTSSGDFTVGTGASVYSPTTNVLTLGTNNAERVRIDSGGRIITGNYSTALDATAGSIIVNGDTSGGRIAQRGSSTSADASLGELFGFWDTNKVAGIIFSSGSDTTNKDDGTIKFYTSSAGPSVTERLRITSDGKVSIGGFNPAVAGLSISNSSTNRGLEFDTGSGFDSTSCIRAYDRPTTAYKSLGLTGSDIKFGINDVKKVSITSGGNVEIANGNLVFSTSGTGIDFSATSDAGGMTSELLDDYEEGTWTPGFQLSSQAGGFTYSGNNGARYTKIGRVVHINGILEWTNHNLTSGTVLQLTGLPFTTSASSNKDRSGISISYAINAYTGITVYQQALRSETNATYMTFNYSNATDGSIDNVPNYTQVSTSGTFIFFGMYIV